MNFFPLQTILAIGFVFFFTNGQQMDERKECRMKLKECLTEQLMDKMEDFKDELTDCRREGRCENPICLKKAVRRTLKDECSIEFDADKLEQMEESGGGVLGGGMKLVKKLLGGRKGRGMKRRGRRSGQGQGNGKKQGQARGTGRGQGGRRGGNPIKKLNKLEQKIREKSEIFCEDPEAFQECALPKIRSQVIDLMMEKAAGGGQSQRRGQQKQRRSRGGKSNKLMKLLGDDAQECKERNADCIEILAEKPSAGEKREMKENRKQKRAEKKERKADKCDCFSKLNVVDLEANIEDECGDLPGDFDAEEFLDMMKEKSCKIRKQRRRPNNN